MATKKPSIFAGFIDKVFRQDKASPRPKPTLPATAPPKTLSDEQVSAKIFVSDTKTTVKENGALHESRSVSSDQPTVKKVKSKADSSDSSSSDSEDGGHQSQSVKTPTPAAKSKSLTEPVHAIVTTSKSSSVDHISNVESTPPPPPVTSPPPLTPSEAPVSSPDSERSSSLSGSTLSLTGFGHLENTSLSQSVNIAAKSSPDIKPLSQTTPEKKSFRFFSKSQNDKSSSEPSRAPRPPRNPLGVARLRSKFEPAKATESESSAPPAPSNKSAMSSKASPPESKETASSSADIKKPEEPAPKAKSDDVSPQEPKEVFVSAPEPEELVIPVSETLMAAPPETKQVHKSLVKTPETKETHKFHVKTQETKEVRRSPAVNLESKQVHKSSTKTTEIKEDQKSTAETSAAKKVHKSINESAVAKEVQRSPVVTLETKQVEKSSVEMPEVSKAPRPEPSEVHPLPPTRESQETATSLPDPDEASPKSLSSLSSTSTEEPENTVEQNKTVSSEEAKSSKISEDSITSPLHTVTSNIASSSTTATTTEPNSSTKKEVSTLSFSLSTGTDSAPPKTEKFSDKSKSSSDSEDSEPEEKFEQKSEKSLPENHEDAKENHQVGGGTGLTVANGVEDQSSVSEEDDADSPRTAGTEHLERSKVLTDESNFTTVTVSSTSVPKDPEFSTRRRIPDSPKYMEEVVRPKTTKRNLYQTAEDENRHYNRGSPVKQFHSEPPSPDRQEALRTIAMAEASRRGADPLSGPDSRFSHLIGSQSQNLTAEHIRNKLRETHHSSISSATQPHRDGPLSIDQIRNSLRESQEQRVAAVIPTGGVMMDRAPRPQDHGPDSVGAHSISVDDTMKRLDMIRKMRQQLTTAPKKDADPDGSDDVDVDERYAKTEEKVQQEINKIKERVVRNEVRLIEQSLGKKTESALTPDGKYIPPPRRRASDSLDNGGEGEDHNGETPGSSSLTAHYYNANRTEELEHTAEKLHYFRHKQDSADDMCNARIEKLLSGIGQRYNDYQSGVMNNYIRSSSTNITQLLANQTQGPGAESRSSRTVERFGASRSRRAQSYDRSKFRSHQDDDGDNKTFTPRFYTRNPFDV